VFALFKKLKQKKIPMILFTNVELEPLYPDVGSLAQHAKTVIFPNKFEHRVSSIQL